MFRPNLNSVASPVHEVMAIRVLGGLRIPKLGQSEAERTSNLAGKFTISDDDECPSEQKPIKNFGEKGALAYPGTAQSF